MGTSLNRVLEERPEERLVITLYINVVRTRTKSCVHKIEPRRQSQACVELYGNPASVSSTFPLLSYLSIHFPILPYTYKTANDLSKFFFNPADPRGIT